MSRSKKYNKIREKINKSKLYSIEEAIKLLPELSLSEANKSVEVHLNLQLPEGKKKEGARFSLSFPISFGQENKILVLTDENNFEKAKKMGADYVGLEDMIKKIKDGWTEFDVVIATPSVMTKVAVLGKILGPKGLMPNPRNQTVTDELEKVIKSYKAGKINLKTDEGSTIHCKFGDLTMKQEELIKNLEFFILRSYEELKRFGQGVFKSIYIAPAMGPSIKLNIEEILKGLTNKE